MRTTTRLLVGCLLSVGLLACASTSPRPALEPVASTAPNAPKPEPEPTPTPTPPVEPSPSSDAAPPPASSATAEATAPAADSAAESRSSSRSALAILTAADTAFLIDYSSSAPIETARRTCAEKSGAEPEARAKCLSDAREAFKADVIRFRKAGAHWSWTAYKRSGSRLDEVTSGRIDFSEDSPNSVKIRFLGDKGMRPLLRNKREAVLTVPNDYSFEVDDAEWGKLKYDAKIGLVAN